MRFLPQRLSMGGKIKFSDVTNPRLNVMHYTELKTRTYVSIDLLPREIRQRSGQGRLVASKALMRRQTVSHW